MDELRPDPLDRPRKDDIVFVGTGCLGLLLTAFGGIMLWGTLHGEPFRGNVGRTLTFGGRLTTSGAILLPGLILLAITVWGLRRMKRKD